MAPEITPVPMPFVVPNAEDENVNWLALSNDEVFDLWIEIRNTPEMTDIVERLRCMMYGKPVLVN